MTALPACPQPKWVDVATGGPDRVCICLGMAWRILRATWATRSAERAAGCMAGVSAAGATQYQGINLVTGTSSAGVRAGVIVGIIFVRAPASCMGPFTRPHPAAALTSADTGVTVINRDMHHSSPCIGTIKVQGAIKRALQDVSSMTPALRNSLRHGNLKMWRLCADAMQAVLAAAALTATLAVFIMKKVRPP